MDRISLQSAWGHGGTVLIEDVDRTDQRLQEDLLRIVTADESGQEARIVATSSVDLRLLAERHGIEDVLAARLSAVTLHVPPLRDRRGDLVPLIRHLAERAGRELARPRPAFTEAALAALQCYEWPGNVGELWEVLRLLATTVPGRPVEPADLPERFRPQGASAEPPTRRLSEVEAVYIREVLASLGGNRSRAAEILGIDRKTLREKLRRDDLASG
jgi:DNA-binding NtrC family response regulator